MLSVSAGISPAMMSTEAKYGSRGAKGSLQRDGGSVTAADPAVATHFFKLTSDSMKKTSLPELNTSRTPDEPRR